MALAVRAEERRTLGLDDALHRAAAAGACLARTAVDAMLPLKPSRPVVGGFVGFVADRRAFAANRGGEHAPRLRGDAVPRGRTEPPARAAWVDAGAKEDLGGIDVADAGDGPLIEKRDLHRAARAAKACDEVGRRHREPVGAELLRSAEPLESAVIDEPDRAQATKIPEHHGRGGGAGPRGQPEHEPHVAGRGGRGRHEPAGHSRFDDQPAPRPARGRGDADEDALAAAVDAFDGRADDFSDHRRRPRLDEDRPHGSPGKLGSGDAPADEEADPASHRLDFGQFGHRVCVCSRRPRPRVTEVDGSRPATGYNRTVR